MSADIALVRAKHTARNSVNIYDPSICTDRQVDPQDIYHMLRNPNTAAIESLSAAVEARDRYTCGHSERVTQYALEIGRALGMDQQALNGLKIAGLLHDLGKIGVPDAILNKVGNLTYEEQQIVQLHPSIGESILRRTPHLDWVIPAVLFHHERWDGTGYPNGLAGDDIPLPARILAIADAFDAMISTRPYRQALSMQHALLELQVGAGKQFDPHLVELFVNHMSADEQEAAA
jgi:HD-GYP domain-containing protein (c-di-GMP phosphodiesterase class II)